MTFPIPVALSSDGQSCCLQSSMVSRHGLITGATGTGKTISLQVMTEGLARQGIPVLVTDIKGDLSGLGAPAIPNDKFRQRLARLGIKDWQPRAMPVTLWDILGKQGHPLRATLSDMGPLLLSRLLGLNETQSGVLSSVFRIADEQGLLLLDLKDLHSLLIHVGEQNGDYARTHGNLSAASLGAIQRALSSLRDQGGEAFFGEPMLEVQDLMQTGPDGWGQVHVLSAESVMQLPLLYGTALLWLLAELFEQLPEAGDLDKPKLVLFFDEAHLLFSDASPALVQKVEQAVRLIRSKGVGIYFVSQNPLDIPESILGQLGNRVQHALRAFTPRDQKAVRAAAQTLRANPGLETEVVIGELGVGEALVSFLDEQGRPQPVERAWILPPSSRIGPLSASERQTCIERSALRNKYEQAIDRFSAYEMLAQAHNTHTPASAPAAARTSSSSQRQKPAPSLTDTAVAVGKSVALSVGRQLGRELVRGLLGSLLGGGRKR